MKEQKKKRGRPTSPLTVQISSKVSPEAVKMLNEMATTRMIVKSQLLDALIKEEHQRWQDSLN